MASYPDPVREEKDTSSDDFAEHAEGAGAGHAKSQSQAPHHPQLDEETRKRLEASHKLANPLAGLSMAQLGRLGEQYAHRAGLVAADDMRAFRLGAMLAGVGQQGGEGVFDAVEGLTEREREVLRRETTHKWSQPMKLYWVIIICSLAAAVQGMDETVVNGGQIFYKQAFGIGSSSDRDSWLVGLLNSAPYLCCAFVGCWLTEPMNRAFGRRGTVFIACVFSAVACFWQAFTNTWWHMFLARFALGLGIGPKSATSPIFAAECAPAQLRGALTMQWQLWTAFGIMLGYVADLAFYFVPDRGVGLGLNWRLMMGSAMLPAVVVICLMGLCVESPRWFLTKDRHQDAYASICRLRFEKVQAARDLFYMNTLLDAEREQAAAGLGRRNIFLEFLTVRRNRNAMIASELVMFMQQFCGVNVICYYSSQIFIDAGFTEVAALAASLGWGVINWLMALPAMFTIDTFGRRNLLLTTFPLMALFLLFTGFSFWIPAAGSQARIGCIALGTYLFGVVYSPGEGPVPFSYSAEAYPLYIRPVGMSLATATTWFFNFVLSVTWPSMLKAFKPQGAFAWYAAWNLVGFVGVLLVMPETKGRTLEELDAVFSVPLRRHAAYGCAQAVCFVRRYCLFQRGVPDVPVPYDEAVQFEESRFVQNRLAGGEEKEEERHELEQPVNV